MRPYLVIEKAGFSILFTGIITEKVMDALSLDKLIGTFFSLEDAADEIGKICNSYKNWRLNGEFVRDPEGQSGRYDRLTPGDIAVMEFGGDPAPARPAAVQKWIATHRHGANAFRLAAG